MARRKQYPKTALIRLTDDEHSRLMNQARSLRLSLSRFLVHAGLTGKVPTYEDRERHERAIMEIKRVGNNLNQIARQLNAQRETMDLKRIQQTLNETRLALEVMGIYLPGR